MEEREIERLAKYFSVLQNRVALKMLFLLKSGPLYVYEITEKLNLKPYITSQILKILRLTDFVGYEQKGKLRKYFLKREDLFNLILQFGKAIERDNR